MSYSPNLFPCLTVMSFKGYISGRVSDLTDHFSIMLPPMVWRKGWGDSRRKMTSINISCPFFLPHSGVNKIRSAKTSQRFDQRLWKNGPFTVNCAYPCNVNKQNITATLHTTLFTGLLTEKKKHFCFPIFNSE